MSFQVWRRRLRRELSWLVALKVAALVLLWWLFFSRHAPVDAQAQSRQLALTGSAVGTAGPVAPSGETRRD